MQTCCSTWDHYDQAHVVPFVQVSKVALPNRKDVAFSRSQQDNTLRPSRDSKVESALRQDLLDLKMSCARRVLSLCVDIMRRASGNLIRSAASASQS
jgi:hypothetical protein